MWNQLVKKNWNSISECYWLGCAALAVSMILLLGLKAIDNTYAKTATWGITHLLEMWTQAAALHACVSLHPPAFPGQRIKMSHRVDMHGCFKKFIKTQPSMASLRFIWWVLPQGWAVLGASRLILVPKPLHSSGNIRITMDYRALMVKAYRKPGVIAGKRRNSRCNKLWHSRNCLWPGP